MPNPLLGGLDAREFLRTHWQKLPLLVRGAIPGFAGLLDFDAMVMLACRDDCESRLVMRRGRRWTVEHGPFDRRRFARLPAGNWTLLVQGLERLLPPARQLLSQFAFIPYARLDDLMVSYAPRGGGVGPHFDSYDVFLLQGPGQRRWRVSRQRDLALVDDAPLKILQRFLPAGECTLGAGDMLYLPPEYAHDGVAVDACQTYSIGFRAPSRNELVSRFLAHLEDMPARDARYADPDLRATLHPAQIDASMVFRVERMLRSVEWGRQDVVAFLGCYLTEPKPQVVFSPPARPLTPAAFSRSARIRGVEPAPGSLMLYAGTRVFINGESEKLGAHSNAVRELADSRRLAGRRVPARGESAALLYRWYRAGYIHLSDPRRQD